MGRLCFEKDGKTAIFKLRKGIKWSDGKPFTVDDILFWYEDFTLDEEARNVPLFPSWWLNDGRPLILEKQDLYTLKISSHRPLGSILHTVSYDEIALPKHWYARFHPRYNASATYAELRERTTRGKLAYEPGTPRLGAWFPISWTHGQRAVFERNPYYWKIDTAGNQLPYADRLEFSVIPNPDVILLRFLNGELDLLGRYFVSRMYQTLKHEAGPGRFTVYLGEPKPSVCFFLNWDAKNPALREAFRNLQVRIALSHGMNRPEIGEVVLHGLLVPTGISLSRSSPFYSEEVVSLYSQYDPGKARSLLNDAGYRDHDRDGIRELKDGSPFELTIDVIADTDFPDICELMVEYWGDIGIKVHLNIALQEITTPRRINGNFEVTLYRAPTDPVMSSEWSAIMGPGEPFWHKNAAREGPPWLHELTALIKRAKTTIDPNERRSLMVRMRNLQAKNVPMVMLGESRPVWAAQNRLGNVPPRIIAELHTRDWDRATFHEQIYIKE
jgi:peptide/nickel transport system substrate-binding protein